MGKRGPSWSRRGAGAEDSAGPGPAARWQARAIHRDAGGSSSKRRGPIGTSSNRGAAGGA